MVKLITIKHESLLPYAWRKLTTRPWWYFETQRSYDSTRKRALKLPPLRSARDAGTLLLVMTRHDFFYDGIWAAWSWLQFIGDLAGVKICIDGEVQKDQAAAIKSVLPNAEVCSAREYINAAPAGSNLLRFGQENPMGRKLLALISESRERTLIYSDDDVLVFNNPLEIRELIANKKAGAFFHDAANALDGLVMERAAERGLDHYPRFNAGCQLIQQGSFPVETAEALLTPFSESFSVSTSIALGPAEQTICSVLQNRSGAIRLPAERYVISGKRQFYWEEDEDYSKIAVRHFIRPVRHVMYLHGYPHLLSRRPGGI